MIHLFSIKDAARHGDLLVSQHRLRYRIFIEKLRYSTSSHDGLEFDRYDNPMTEYLVWANADRQVLAMARFYPTIHPYMIEECWPHLVTRGDIPKSKSIIEGSRFCLDDSIGGTERNLILDHMVEAVLKLGRARKYTAIVGVMQPKVWSSLFESRGWPVHYLGDVAAIEHGERVVAAQLTIGPQVMLFGKYRGAASTRS